MILYIAGPMTGIADFNYPAFRDAERALVTVGYEIRNPTDITGTPDATKTAEWYMRHSIRMLTEADGIALLPGWEESSGANGEYMVGMMIGVPARPLVEWLDLTPTPVP